MATTSYGKITIIDVTDVGNFSVYPYANGPNTQIYSEETNGYIPDWTASNNSLILTPVVTYAGQDKTADATVNWYLKTDLEHPITTGNGYTVNSNKSLSIAKNIPAGNTYVVYVVKASYITDTGANVSAQGEITFSKLTQTSSVKAVNITGTNVIKYASDSTTPVPSTITLTASLTGESYLTSDGWYYYNGSQWLTATGVTGLTVNQKQLTITPSYNNSAAYFIADVARFKFIAHASADSTDIYEDIFSVFQLRDGATGGALVRLDLTNDDQLVPINSSGVAQWASIGDLAKTKVYVYRGRDIITNECSITATLSNVTVEFYNDSDNKYTGSWNSGDALPAGYYTVKVTGFTNSATNGSVYFSTTVDGLNYTETFSLVGAPAGTNGQTPTIYTLDFSSIPAYVNNPTGSAAAGNLQDNWSYLPADLVIKAYQIETDINGVSTRTPYNGRIWYTPNIVNGVAQTGNSTWGNLTLINGQATLEAASKLLVNNSPYIFRLVGAGESNIADNIKDEETINILSDGNIGNAGNDGDDAISLLINNENVTLNCTEDGKTRATNITVGYQGYVGTSEDSHFQLNNSNKGSSSKSGLVTINNISVDTTNKIITIPINANVSVSKGETGTVTLNFLYTGVTPNLNISKIISWDAKLDAKDGESAIILTFEYGGNKTTYFKNEIGETKVTPILLQDGVNLLTGKTVGTDYSVTWKDLITDSNLSGADIEDGITAVINASDISGVGSYSCAVTYNGKTYIQYISFTDYSDPLQVQLISTIGDKLTNGIGQGVVYSQTTREGAPLDQVSSNMLVVQGLSAAPADAAQGDFYFKTGDSKVYKKGASSWTVDTSYDQVLVRMSSGNPLVLRNLSGSAYTVIPDLSTLTYEWSFRDGEGNVINPNSLSTKGLKVSNSSSGSASFTTTKVTGGQFIYIDKNIVNKKIVILCKVTKN